MLTCGSLLFQFSPHFSDTRMVSKYMIQQISNKLVAGGGLRGRLANPAQK